MLLLEDTKADPTQSLSTRGSLSCRVERLPRICGPPRAGWCLGCRPRQAALSAARTRSKGRPVVSRQHINVSNSPSFLLFPAKQKRQGGKGEEIQRKEEGLRPTSDRGTEMTSESWGTPTTPRGGLSGQETWGAPSWSPTRNTPWDDGGGVSPRYMTSSQVPRGRCHLCVPTPYLIWFLVCSRHPVCTKRVSI